MSYPYGRDHPNVHEHGEIESSPDIDDVYQEEEPEPTAVPVKVNHPVQVHILPSRMGVSRNYQVGTTNVVPLLNANPKRRRATLLATLTTSADSSTSRGVFIGQNADALSGEAAVWPYNVPLVVEHSELIYVRAQGTLTTAAQISVITEDWAD